MHRVNGHWHCSRNRPANSIRTSATNACDSRTMFNAAFRGLTVRCAAKNPVAHFIWNEHDACASIRQIQFVGNPRWSMASVHTPSFLVTSRKVQSTGSPCFRTAAKKFNKRLCTKTVLQHWLDICGGSQIISIRRPYKIFAGLFIGSPLLV